MGEDSGDWLYSRGVSACFRRPPVDRRLLKACKAAMRWAVCSGLSRRVEGESGESLRVEMRALPSVAGFVMHRPIRSSLAAHSRHKGIANWRRKLFVAVGDGPDGSERKAA